MLNRIQVTIDKERDRELGVIIRITVSRFNEHDLHIQRVVPDNDFESYFDYAWRICKQMLDAALAKELENG